MTVELIDLPNPPPMASRLPSEALKLAKDLTKQGMEAEVAESKRLSKRRRLHRRSNDIPEG